MKNKNNNKQKGFISLLFVLTISFIFLTWISLSSERVFNYIYIKDEFTKNRSYLHDHVLCADSFINSLISSDYNIQFDNGIYTFYRELYYQDDYRCQIKDIQVTYENSNISKIFFISGDFSFEYKFKNGFVNFIKSSDLF